MVKVINVLALPYYIICIEIEYNVERRTTARAEQLFTRGYSGIGALRGPQTCELLMNIHIDGGIQPMK